MQPKKFLTHLTTYALKTTIKRVIQKTRETTKIAEILRKVTKVSKTSQQNNSWTITNERNKETPKKRYISPEERQKIIDDLRVI